ncbi:tetratricopeptide repeat protein [Aliifodinibius sp. S!AR15-10]|uniref:tetratricopeptide repeat protein n=1 Tax=Aliifodinibius sp. S!AR15-10 TaxID=2950437 RepID=UPI0028607910|nr:tetratricopeptide repeat protein [Aliifodinibius sp. S!AR15-10]MDR8389630.1 tetratricopeptide repeat protein [Aliifodinibius sp. S!AR15-10]
MECSSLYAQTVHIDSLKSELKNVSGIPAVEILSELTEALQRDHPAEAISYAEEALSILRNTPNTDLEVDILFHKAWAHYARNEYDSVWVHANLITKLANTAKRDEYLVRALLLEARILRYNGAYADGIALLDSAIALNIEANNFLQPLILNEMGSILRRQGKTEEALDYHSRALEIMKQLNDHEGLATTLGYIGIIHDVRGHYAEALRAHQQALELRESLGDKKGAAASLTNIGIVYQKVGKYEEALDFYDRSLVVWNELEMPDQIASTLNNTGAVYELLQNYEEALKYYQKALAIWKERGNSYSISIALSNVGSVQMYLGDYISALEYQNEALHNRETLGDKYGVANTLLDISEVYLEKGEPDSALVAAEHSLALSEEIGSWSLIRDTYEMLYTIYESNGDYENALTHYRNFRMAQDSIFNSESQSVIAELQEQYRTRQQQQRIELLQQTQEVQTLWLAVLVGGILLVSVILILLYNRFKLKQRAHDALQQVHQTEIEKATLRTEAAEAMSNYLQAENERQTQELEAARNLQLSLLPSEIPQTSIATISAYMQTAAEVGGDYYDFFKSDDGTLTIIIGDATGHGTKAGTLVTATKSLFTLLANEDNLISILQRCSEAIKKMNLPKLYMALGLIRLKGNKAELVGAGMPPALLYHANENTIEQIPLKGMPLGSVSDYPYRQTTVEIAKDDILLLATDGLPELVNELGQMFGYDRMPEVLAEITDETPDKIIDHFRQQAKKWLNGGLQDDDMTFVALKIN